MSNNGGDCQELSIGAVGDETVYSERETLILLGFLMVPTRSEPLQGAHLDAELLHVGQRR